MADHQHNSEVAMFGECVTCARRTEQQARLAKERAIAGVAAGAPEAWVTEARKVVRELAAAGADFTTDDVWQLVPLPPEPRAMGAVMVWAETAGLVVPTGRTMPSTRPECHARPVRVWAPAARALPL